MGQFQELYSKANPKRIELSCRFFGYAGNISRVKFTLAVIVEDVANSSLVKKQYSGWAKLDGSLGYFLETRTATRGWEPGRKDM